MESMGHVGHMNSLRATHYHLCLAHLNGLIKVPDLYHSVIFESKVRHRPIQFCFIPTIIRIRRSSNIVRIKPNIFHFLRMEINAFYSLKRWLPRWDF